MAKPQKDAVIPKFPKKIFVYYMLTNILPALINGPVLAFIGEVKDLDQFTDLILNPVFVIGFFVLGILVPYLGWSGNVKKIYALDPSDPESIEKVNKTVKNFETLHIFSGLLTGFLQAVFIAISLGIAGIPFDTSAIVFVCIATTLLFALSPYILYMQQLEGHVWKLDFQEKYKSMPLIVRNILVIGFATIGLVLVTMSPVLVKANSSIPHLELFITKMLPVAIAAELVALFDTLLLARGVTERIAEIKAFTAELVNRNYANEKLHVKSRDEFGMLINNLNEFYTTTHDLLVAITQSIDVSKNSADTLATSMEETSASITEIGATINSIQQRITNQAAGVEEAKATTENMVRNINSLEAQVSRQTESVSESSSAVEEMVANIRSVTEILRRNSDNVTSLSNESETGRTKIDESVKRAEEILEKSAGLLEATKIIQNIASQTNLLAMNAAIEAAHAGDSGKGFAVVADEIRKLAEQSNTQGKHINTQLKELQASIGQISEGTAQVQNQFNVIYDLTDTVKKQEQVIMSAMQEQSAGGTQVLDSINTIRETSAAVKVGSEEIAESSAQVAKEMGLLADVTIEINESTTSMASGAQQIVSSVNEVNTASNENRENLQKIAQEIGRFKL